VTGKDIQTTVFEGVIGGGAEEQLFRGGAGGGGGFVGRAACKQQG
jgi:hypothetical protein